jgi:hypothetical protein
MGQNLVVQTKLAAPEPFVKSRQQFLMGAEGD